MENSTARTNSKQIKYCLFEERRLDGIVDTLVQNFAADELLCRLCRGCEGGQPEDHRGWIRQAVMDHDWRVSVLAIDVDTDRTVGVCVSDVMTPGSADPLAAMEQTGTEACRLINGFLSQVVGDYDVFKAFGVNTVLYINMVTVDQRYRGRGISHELMQQSMELGRRVGCQLATTTATSPYMRRTFSKLGFRQERYLPLTESQLADSEKIDLSHCGPDEGGAFMVLRL